jgi:glycosyltransferase involved in cell wall biosynthesis
MIMNFKDKINEKSEILLSVVMAVYNSDKFLCESIESVLSQTYPHFEFIIVNDNSSDTSEIIIQKYAAKDKRIVYLTNEVNSKQSETRNKAIKIAKGGYIVVVDSDDICVLNRFEKQLHYFIRNPDCDVLGSSYCLFYDDKVDECKSVVSASVSDIYDGKPLVHNPTCMIKREVFLNHGYYESKYDNAEDYELWSRWFSQGVIFHNLPEVLYKKRIHEGCVSVSRIKHQLYLMLKINIIALYKYHRRFTLAGYLRLLEQFFYFIYLGLRLDRIYRRTKPLDRVRDK